MSVDSLANMQYAGNIRLKLNGEFIYAYHPQQGNIGAHDWHFRLSPRSGVTENTVVNDGCTVFQLEMGHYAGGVTGYWIRYSGMAWQANPGAGLTFWNNDRQARGAPEDNEMFYFEVIDVARSLVRIRSRYAGYVQLSGTTLNVGADAAHAASFEALLV
jgi:hypothetical protein